jgi:tetraacyldisaccharide 4'-kinase
MANKSFENNNPKKGSEQTSKLQQWLEKIWYNNGSGKFFLAPLTALYCVINSYQRFKTRKNQTDLPCPVIVVGNITVGGTGKTPLTIYIVNILKSAGYKPAIITRGYGGQATSWPQSVTEKSDPKQVGDEAVLMATKAQVPVYAGANRLQSIEMLSKAHDCNIIVSDDGMQHYKLPRDIQIAVLDGSRMLGNGWCLPSGPLREKKQRLKACDLLIVNGKIAEGRENDLQSMPFFSMSLKGIKLINLHTKESLRLEEFANKTVHAVTGIGNPQRFYNTLRKQGGLHLKTHSFPDHYDFIEKDLHFSDELPIIMTEKDAVKCQKFQNSNIWTLPVTAELEDGFKNELLMLLKR